MGIDIVDLGWAKMGLVERCLHGSGGTLPVGKGLGNMEGIGAGPIGDDFSQDIGAARLSILKILKNKDGRPLADDKAITLGIKGAGGLLWLAVPG